MKLIDFSELSKIVRKDMLIMMESSEIDVIIGRNLTRIRIMKDISQEKLAEMIDTPATRLSAYENGREGMGKDIMTRICNALNIRPWEFYLEETTPIIYDDIEQDIIGSTREAKKMSSQLAENIARYGKFVIKESRTIEKDKEE